MSDSDSSVDSFVFRRRTVQRNVRIESGSSSSDTPVPHRNAGVRRGTYEVVSQEKKQLFVKLYEEGFSVKDAAQKSDIKYNTGKSILKKYRKNSFKIIKY